MKIIHLTDLHLPEPGQMLWGLDAYGRVESAFQDIERWHADADFCVISGDLTDRGAPGAYAWLAERLERFGLETVLMVGNHDARDVMRAGLPHVMDDGNGFVQGVRETEVGTFLFLDTYKDGTSPGQFCLRRQQWLRDCLAEVEGPVRIFMHHPPFDIGIPYMDRIKLEDADAFAGLVAGHDVRHIFFGHVHRACFVNWRSIPCNALPGTNHQVPLVREATGAAYSVEPPMYGVITITADQTTVHLDAFMDRSPAEMPK